MSAEADEPDADGRLFEMSARDALEYARSPKTRYHLRTAMQHELIVREAEQ